MLRTQIYLAENIHTRLNQIKKVKGVSMGRLIRKYIEKGIEEETVEDNGLWKLASLGIKGGDPNLSKNYKQYLYGKWRKQL
jgi:predicted DNA-binding protein